jgi:thiol-disulfide isomerase/thioredoxin
LIQFWTTWCGYCRRDQPFIEQLTVDYPESKLVVLAVSVGESRQKIKDYLATSPRRSKIIANEDTNLPAAFGASGFPAYIVLDAKGRIAGRQDGAGGDSIRDLLRKAGLE